MSSWQDEGICHVEKWPTHLFFPDPDIPTDRLDRLLERTCFRCPVRRECLAHAMEQPEEYGIWGGLTEDDRKTLRRYRD